MDFLRSEPCSSHKLNISFSETENKEKHSHSHSHPHLLLNSHTGDDESKHELNLINCLDTDTSMSMNSSSESNHGNELEPRIFSCNYCQRKFYSSHALGGHKRERSMAKRGHKFAVSLDFDHRYSSFASLPLHGPYNRSPSSSPLGIHVHSSIIQKTCYGTPFFGLSRSRAQNKWQKLPMYSQPASRNFHVEVETVESSLASGIPTRKVQDGFEGSLLGDNATATTRLKSEQDELQKLDLPLKL